MQKIGRKRTLDTEVSLFLVLSFLRSGFFVCSKETNGTMTEGGEEGDFSLWKSPSFANKTK